MRLTKLPIALAVLLLPVSVASAGQIIAQTSGLSGTDHVIDFGANLYPNFTNISNEFAGATFTHSRYFTTGSVNNIVGGFLTNDFSGAPDTFTVVFDNPVTDVSFVYHQISTAAPSNFRVLLGGVLVDSFSNLSDQTQPNNYFGFTGLLFDELQLDFQSDFNVDTFAYNDGSPAIPGTAYCFGDGTGTNCPCSAFGAAGQGCANTGGMGATLTGSGTASFSGDTFKLAIDGVPGSKPGLVLRGDNQISAPAGDGILCTSGGSQRSQVQMTTAAGQTTFTDFHGSPFGAVANMGSPTNFQFWYRDPSNTCSGAGFNFTNAWTVTYQP